MAVYLGDINARARGLRTRLTSARDLERLTRVPSLFALQRELAALNLASASVPATPESLEAALRQRAAQLMSILRRWSSDEREPILTVLLEDEERRSLDRILRGADQGAASDARLSGVLPTGRLSERALRVLAGQPTMADVVRMLLLWNHPFGAPLLDAVSGPRPRLFEVEVALQRAFARRALARARKGGQELLDYAQQLVDLMNAWSALLHVSEHEDSIVDLTFVEGGRWIDREALEQLLSCGSIDEVWRGLTHTFGDSALCTVFAGATPALAGLEGAVLQAQIAEQGRIARIHPQSAAPLIRFYLELRAESLNLRRIIWGVSLRTPAAMLRAEMVAT